MLKQYSYGIKRMFRLNTVSNILAVQLRNILLRLDIFASINPQKRTGNRKTMYCIYVGGAFLPKFTQIIETEIANEVVVQRSKMWQSIKQTNAKSYAQISKNYAFVPIKRISYKEVDNLPVHNFSVEEDESYVAGGVVVHNCTAPRYSTNSLHTAVVEVIAKKGAHIRYTTIQNWSPNVYNLVTKRAHAHEDSTVEWVDCNLGSLLTMKYPSVYMLGPRAKADIISVALAGKGQHQDAGAKVVHMAPNTTSTIISKSISKDGGRASYRGLLRVTKGATNVKSSVRCDALILDEKSRSDTYPSIEIAEEDATIAHEATVGKIGEDQLFYLTSRGLSEQEAMTMIVMGFFRPFTKQLPMEYAVEMNRLIELEMEGSVG